MPSHKPEQPPIRYYSTLTAKQVDWLWYPYIPYGKLTVVQGDPASGKTTFVLNVAALLSVGQSMPESGGTPQKAAVLYQSAEDSAEDTMKPRLICAGADCGNIAFIDETDGALSLDSPRLESAIIETGARLLVLDPLQAYLGESGELNRADGIRPMLKRLSAVAERTRCAVVIIGHMNKTSGAKGLYRGLGSIDITAAARSVLLVGRSRHNPQIRVMAQIKNSLAQEGAAIAFEINENSGVHWIGTYDVSVEELLLGTITQDNDSKTELAQRILRDTLRTGETLCRELYAKCSEKGVSKRTVDQAKKQLDIKSIRRAGSWYWTFDRL
jgi:hypothetical protein